MRHIGHFIGGKAEQGKSGRFGDVYAPHTGEAQARVSLASAAEVADAVANAKAAQPAWAAQNPQKRARVLIKFLEAVQKEMRPLAELLSSEHGKTVADSIGDIQRGLEVVEFAIGAPHFLKGEFSDNAGPGIDMYSMRQPLGVTAGITPFNFPAMIPLWKAAPAIACGNAFLLKPSERDPSVPMRLAELFMEAGLPAGVFNVVNGDKEAVDAILTHPDVKAVGFVGSTAIAHRVYSLGAAHGKRVQAFGGAKNHMIVMPDADMGQAADALMGAGYGSAGERCMAISVAVPVGEETANRLVAALAPRVESLKAAPYTDEKADFGPLVTAAAVARVKELVQSGVDEGAELVIDGRGFAMQGYEKGFFMGPCLFDRVKPSMRIYREEIFGPVLSVVRARDYEEGLALANHHEYGNGVAIFTRDGDAARDFASRVDVGMVGVNVPIPVPLAYHTFGGWKKSMFGDLNQHGPDSMRFYTKTKTVTARWPSGVKDGAEFVIPTMK
ncbi:MAG: CoA-acylating methylmalonate-semialdehyde dehydrogenase [Rhodomicrobium sp.]